MQKNFHELKRQLAELSETINKFESEAVQLRIVELVFNQAREGRGFAEAAAEPYVPTPARASRRRGAAPSASGAVAALAKLIESDFFNERRSIGDVVKKCEKDFGTRYRSNAFSGPLSRYAKSGALKREKNAEGKYVYFK